VYKEIPDHQAVVEVSMAHARLPARIALGAAGALIIAAAALAQAPQPAPAPTVALPPQYPPTATITTPGYPALGPADPKLRVTGLPNGKKVHLLPATLDTTQWGWFDNAQPPVLRVHSGDTIVMETMMHSHNQVVPGTTIEQIKKLRTDFPGRGPHTLTGPIYIEEAQPGDVLKVTLNKIVPRAYATNFNVPGMFGEFPSLYQDGQVKYLYLDLDTMTTEFLPGVVLPLRPFPGTLGIARKEPGRYSSVPPGEYAGNMDIRDFIPGSTLYVPVQVPGALLWSGDSHAGQGNGEVNLTAMESAFKELNITVEVVKGTALDFPRIETAKSWITMGMDQDLNKAWTQAKAQTVKFLAEQRGIPAAQAETLMTGVSDCRVSQVVNVKKGIHCLSPKNASDKEDLERPTAETSAYYVSHVKDADLNKAMDQASMGMIKLLETEKKIARLDAYGLASVAMDCRVGAISDTEKNVHCLLPKSIFVANAGKP
jgi:acetamidase/formamidase